MSRSGTPSVHPYKLNTKIDPFAVHYEIWFQDVYEWRRRVDLQQACMTLEPEIKSRSRRKKY